MRLADFDDWARAHHGLLSLDGSGMSRAAWYRALESGTLVQVHPKVARLPGTPATPEQRILAAVLAVGPTAIASHRSSARLWGIPRPDDDHVDLIDSRDGCQANLDGVFIHRPSDRARLSPLRRYGIPCTNVIRVLADLGAVDPDAVSGAVGHVLATRLADLAALETAALEHGRRGRPGIPVLRDAIDDWSIDQKPADSLLESAMARLVQRHRLPPVEFHPVIDGHEVDFRFVDSAVIMECDGWAYHGLDRSGFERDRSRDADLTAAGWIVVRFTYRAVITSPSTVARRISAAFERWSSLTPPDAA
jgi:very-short-patch-repair endonuclease